MFKLFQKSITTSYSPEKSLVIAKQREGAASHTVRSSRCLRPLRDLFTFILLSRQCIVDSEDLILVMASKGKLNRIWSHAELEEVILRTTQLTRENNMGMVYGPHQCSLNYWISRARKCPFTISDSTETFGEEPTGRQLELLKFIEHRLANSHLWGPEFYIQSKSKKFAFLDFLFPSLGVFNTPTDEDVFTR